MITFFYDNWKDITISFIGAFFGFGLALLIEYWKNQSDKKKEKKAVNEEMNSKIEYFKILLEQTKKNSNQQIELIKQNIEKQNENYLYPVPLKRISTNYFIRLKNIDSRGVFEALNDRFKHDADWMTKYTKLNSCLDFAESVFCEELVRINKITLEKGYNDQLYIKSLIDDTASILADKAIDKSKLLKENRHYDDEYDFINTAILVYHELVNDKADLERLESEFLVPLLSKIQSFEIDDYTKRVLFNSRGARVRMNNLRNDIRQTTSTYQEIIDALQKPMEEIDNMIIMLSNLKKQRNKSDVSSRRQGVSGVGV